MSPIKMGTLPVGVLLCLAACGLGPFLAVITAELPECSNDATVQKCCLCEDSDSCGITCPVGYVQKDLPCVNTTQSSGETIHGTSMTTQAPSLTTQANVPASNMSGTICVKCTGDQFFNDNSTECESCHPACNGCNGGGDEACIVCKYVHNNGCVAVCPHGTETGNVTTTDDGNMTHCEPVAFKEESEDNKSLYIYIGSGMGGGALILVVVVVVGVICYKRRNSDNTELRANKTTGRTAMSQIIKKRDKDGTGDKPPDRPSGVKNKMGNAPPVRRHNYENTESPGPGFAKDIEQQQDNVLRYTKDPTVRTNKSENPETNRDSSESIYENSTMVQLNKRIDLSNRSPDDIQKAIEAQELTQLPVAPALPKPAKSKAGIIKRLSQRVSKKLASKKKAPPQEPDPEDYIDMSQNEDGLEDYENMTFTGLSKKASQDQSVGAKTSTVNQSATMKQEDGAKIKTRKQTDKKGKTDDNDLEDYENFRKVSQIEEEDYENATFRSTEPVKQELEEEEEDYENMTKTNTKPVQQEEELEDYENVGTLSNEENPYMNVTLKKP